MGISKKQIEDPQGYVADLAEAVAAMRAAKVSDAEAFGKAAFNLLATRGLHELYGQRIPRELSDELFRLDVDRFCVPAMVHGCGQAAALLVEMQLLPSRCRESEPPEDVSYCASIIHQLMSLWALYVFVDDVYQTGLHVGRQEDVFGGPAAWSRPGFSEMHAVYGQLLDQLDATDRPDTIAALSLIATTSLLDNLRGELSAPYEDDHEEQVWPWWLDGRLEEAAKARTALA